MLWHCYGSKKSRLQRLLTRFTITLKYSARCWTKLLAVELSNEQALSIIRTRIGLWQDVGGSVNTFARDAVIRDSRILRKWLSGESEVPVAVRYWCSQPWSPE